MATANKVLERVKVREVAGVFRARDMLDAAVHALLSSGFDRADIDLVVGAEAHERLGGAKVAAEELPEVPAAPRQPFIASEDIVLVWSLVLSIFDLRRRRICRLDHCQIRGRTDMGWCRRGDRGDCCWVGRGTTGSRLCAQAYQAP